MKRMMSVLMLILGVFTASAARAEEKSVEQTLTGIEQEIADKMVKGDVSAMEAYAADTLSFTDPGGALMDRAALLAEFKSDKLKFEMVKLDEVKVVLVPDPAYGAADEARLVQELRMRLGNEMKIEFQYVERIERGKGGKLKSIVSRLK